MKFYGPGSYGQQGNRTRARLGMPHPPPEYGARPPVSPMPGAGVTPPRGQVISDPIGFGGAPGAGSGPGASGMGGLPPMAWGGPMPMPMPAAAPGAGQVQQQLQLQHALGQPAPHQLGGPADQLQGGAQQQPVNDQFSALQQQLMRAALMGQARRRIQP